jgi:hypothetical protein
VSNPTGAEIVRKLKVKPGRGGVRLSGDEAQLLLAMLEAGARAIDGRRRHEAVEISGHDFVELANRHQPPADPVGDALRALEARR